MLSTYPLHLSRGVNCVAPLSASTDCGAFLYPPFTTPMRMTLDAVVSFSSKLIIRFELYASFIPTQLLSKCKDRC